MGGRLVAELAAREPERALAVVLVNAIAGDAWDRLNRLLLVAPAGYLGVGAVLLADVAASLPLREDPLQSLKLARLIFPTSANHVRRPWRLLGPFQAIARARASSGALERLRAAAIPTVVIHGERDLAVPLSTGRASAARAGADLVVVAGAGHSWLLGDPEAFPAIIAEQLEVGLLGRARTAALAARGLASDATAAEIEAAFINPASLVSALTPPAGGGRERGRPPRLRWTTTPAHSVMDPESGYSATTA
jgi:pimeloyl-ACP methyl ester carboxylesterase